MARRPPAKPVVKPTPAQLDTAVSRYKATLDAWRACDRDTPAVASGAAYDQFSVASECLENLLRRQGGLVVVQGEAWWVTMANLVAHTPLGSRRHRRARAASACYQRGLARAQAQRCPDGKGGSANAAAAGASTGAGAA